MSHASSFPGRSELLLILCKEFCQLLAQLLTGRSQNLDPMIPHGMHAPDHLEVVLAETLGVLVRLLRVQMEADLVALRPHWEEPDATADPPYALETVYLAQTRESSKTSGRILIDNVSVDVFSTQPPE